MNNKNWASWLTRRSAGFLDKNDENLFLGNFKCHRKNHFLSIGPNLLGDNGDIPNNNPNLEPPTYVMKFCPVPGYHEIIGLANEDGRIAFQDTKMPRKEAGPNIGFMKGMNAHSNAIFDLNWDPNRVNRFLTASGDKTIKLWDLSSGSSSADLKCLNVYKGHERSVKVAEFQPGNSEVFASGARDNTIRIWDTRSNPGNCENLIKNPHIQNNNKKFSKKSNNGPSSITALKFLNDHELVSCSDKDNTVKVWDLRRSYSLFTKDPLPKFQFRPNDNQHGYNSLVVDSQSKFVYASCMDKKIYQFNTVSYDKSPCKEYLGCDNQSFYLRICLSSDDKFLVCGSRDHNIYIWNTSLFPEQVVQDKKEVPQIEPESVLEGHTAEVTCVDWCKSQWRIISCADDLRHRIWEVDRNEMVEKFDLVGWATPFKQEQSYVSDPSLIKGQKVADFFKVVRRPLTGLSDSSLNKKVLTTSPGKVTTTKLFPCSPRKMNVTPKKNHEVVSSPRKLYLSPTVNLPNLVRDSKVDKSAEMKRTTPIRKTSTNWLTTLSNQKKKDCTGNSKRKKSAESPKNSTSSKRRRKLLK